MRSTGYIKTSSKLTPGCSFSLIEKKAIGLFERYAMQYVADKLDMCMEGAADTYTKRKYEQPIPGKKLKTKASRKG